MLENIQIFLGAGLGAVAQGVLWGIMALGVYITFKILDFADMTVDGSFALGGCVCALLVFKGFNPFLAVLIAGAAGSLAGFCTGILTTKLKIPGILSGILMMLALYSINLRILARPNLPLDKKNVTIMNICNNIFGFDKIIKDHAVNVSCLVTGVIFCGIIIAILYWFFGTEIGSCIRSTGDNPAMTRAQGVSTSKMQVLALMLANALVSVSGAFVAQQQRVGDVGMGIGAIVIGLASIIIGEVVFGKRFGFWWLLIGVVLGSIVYRLIIAVVLQLGMKTQDMKLLSAVVVIIALSVPLLKKKLIPPKQNNVGGDE